MRQIRGMWVEAIVAATLLAAAADPGVPEAAPAVTAEKKAASASTAISTNPIAVRLGYFSLEAEHAVAGDLTFFVEPSFVRLRDVNGLASLRGGGLAGGARWYVVGRAMNGWFVAPELFVNALALRGDTVGEARVGFGAGAVLGGSWILWNHVYASVGAGFMSQFRGYALTGVPIHRVATGPTLRLNLGGAF